MRVFYVYRGFVHFTRESAEAARDWDESSCWDGIHRPITEVESA